MAVTSSASGRRHGDTLSRLRLVARPQILSAAACATRTASQPWAWARPPVVKEALFRFCAAPKNLAVLVVADVLDTPSASSGHRDALRGSADREREALLEWTGGSTAPCLLASTTSRENAIYDGLSRNGVGRELRPISSGAVSRAERWNLLRSGDGGWTRPWRSSSRETGPRGRSSAGSRCGPSPSREREASGGGGGEAASSAPAIGPGTPHRGSPRRVVVEEPLRPGWLPGGLERAASTRAAARGQPTCGASGAGVAGPVDGITVAWEQISGARDIGRRDSDFRVKHSRAPFFQTDLLKRGYFTVTRRRRGLRGLGNGSGSAAVRRPPSSATCASSSRS